MGYRSDLIIAVSNEIILEDMVANTIPKIIKQLDFKLRNIGTYYRIEGWKWYDDDRDVSAILEWFSSMEETQFGAVRVGEDSDDIEEWGTPYIFDIYVQTTIDSPFCESAQ